MSGPLRSRRSRRQTPGRFKLHKQPWQDPFPNIPGTEPEKRIFEALVRRRIYFVFQGQIPEFEHGIYVTLANKKINPDFILPQYRVILDPYSPFHHSLPERVEKDAYKHGLYSAMGYRVYHPWALPNGLFLLDQALYSLKPGQKRLKIVREVHGRAYGALDLLALIAELQGAKRKVLDKRDRKNIARGVPFRLGQYLGRGAHSVAAANAARAKRKGFGLELRSGTRRRKRVSRRRLT